MMNKLLVFPLVIMLAISVFGIYVLETNDNPGDTGELLAEGYFASADNGDIVWYYNNTYQGFFTNMDYYHPYDPRNAPDTPFRLLGGTGEDGFSTLDAFYDYWDSEEPDSFIKDILNTNYFWAIILGILGTTVVLGVQVFGSGLSEFAQRTSFIGIGWGAMWAFLTVIAYDMLLVSELGIYGQIIYLILTISFIIGVILEVTGGDD